MEVCTQKRKTVQKFSKRQRHVDSQRSADDVTGPGRKGCRVAGDGCSGVSMSGGWMRRHVADVFVKKSVQMQLRSRAAFKLMQIDARHHILLPKGADRHVKVVDCGCAPGGWLLAIKHILHEKRKHFKTAEITATDLLIGVDLNEMEPIENVNFIKGNFTEESVQQRIMQLLRDTETYDRDAAFDLVCSDMAPSTTGQNDVDCVRSVDIARSALDFASRATPNTGTHFNFLCKVFMGDEFASFVAECKARFRFVKVLKPEASRKQSAEVYVLARNYPL